MHSFIFKFEFSSECHQSYKRKRNNNQLCITLCLQPEKSENIFEKCTRTQFDCRLNASPKHRKYFIPPNLRTSNTISQQKYFPTKLLLLDANDSLTDYVKFELKLLKMIVNLFNHSKLFIETKAKLSSTRRK